MELSHDTRDIMRSMRFETIDNILQDLQTYENNGILIKSVLKIAYVLKMMIMSLGLVLMMLNGIYNIISSIMLCCTNNPDNQ